MDALLTQLRHTWHQTIPVSEFMQISPLSFIDNELRVSAPIAPNINLHQTMFAGSIYTLMTLTGWGMVWLQQQLQGVDGDIVLADAHIRYLAPVTHSPEARVVWQGADLSTLLKGKKAKVKLEVKLYCGDSCCAVFEGLYFSVP
ncbi:thioesterase domain-containing protein [Shewanella sp. A25]|nr:thioesterase domain-containing protein [Shewanella shenzhenensis]